MKNIKYIIKDRLLMIELKIECLAEEVVECFEQIIINHKYKNKSKF